MIEGDVLVDPPVALDRAAAAIVRLRETAMADAPARILATVRVACAGASVRRIPFRLAATVERGRDYSLAAEVRRDGGDRLHPGDLLTVEHRGWTASETGRVELRVRPTR